MSGFVQMVLMGDITSIEKDYIEVNIGKGKYWKCKFIKAKDGRRGYDFIKVPEGLIEGQGIYLVGIPGDELNKIYANDYHRVGQIIKQNPDETKTCYHGTEQYVR